MEVGVCVPMAVVWVSLVSLMGYSLAPDPFWGCGWFMSRGRVLIPGILWDMVDKWVVHILLECFLLFVCPCWSHHN